MKEKYRDYRNEAKQKLDRWLKEHPIDVDFEKPVEEDKEDEE